LVGIALAGVAMLLLAGARGAEQKTPANAPGTSYIPYPGPTRGVSVFSHVSHQEAGYKCTDCHTALFEMKRGTVKMADLYQGKACGKCHDGKTKAPADAKRVAAAVTDCGACHTPDKPIVYINKGPGKVEFSHALHTADAKEVKAGFSCSACHPKLFARKANEMKMPLPHVTGCATCHNGETKSPQGKVAPAVGTSCMKCHQPG
jgi:c(7)-type cytochrome triheme protein